MYRSLHWARTTTRWRAYLSRVSHMAIWSMWNPMFLFHSSVLGPSLRLPLHKYLHSFAALAWPAGALLILSGTVHSSISHHVPILAAFLIDAELDRAEFRLDSFLHSFGFLCCFLVPSSDCLFLNVLYTYTIRMRTHTHLLVATDHHSITCRIRRTSSIASVRKVVTWTPYLLQDPQLSPLSPSPHTERPQRCSVPATRGLEAP
jgi:hypothetical protein